MHPSTPTSETDQARAFVQPHHAEPLPALLHRVIPAVQRRRAAAYARLHAALRRSSAPAAALQPPPPEHPHNTPANPHLPALDSDYRAIVANVTEDLKLSSEAVIELRSVVAAWPDTRAKLAPQTELSAALQWLDALQDLEERKLLATVSLHAVQRSAAAAPRPAELHQAPDLRAKISKYAKDLNAIDSDINDLLQEINEYFLDFQVQNEHDT